MNSNHNNIYEASSFPKYSRREAEGMNMKDKSTGDKKNSTKPLKFVVIPTSKLFYKKVNDSASIGGRLNFHNYLKSFPSNNFLDHQIADIYNIFSKNGAFLRPLDQKTALELFIKNFEKCDTTKDNKINLTEFDHCVKTDPYLQFIKATPLRYATFANFSYTEENGFNAFLFKILDGYENNKMNFYDYLMLRLMAFAWKKCSVNTPYMDEQNFECAIDITSGWHSLPRNTARQLFKLILALAPNGEKLRNIDFISYFLVANSIRLYGKINVKEDNDATKADFKNAMDASILPARYGDAIIDLLFNLVHGKENIEASGIDVQTFFFFDYYLRIFYQGLLTNRKWYLDLTQFEQIISSNILPTHIYRYFKTIPQNKITQNSFYSSLFPKINQDMEENYFIKFLEVKSGIFIDLFFCFIY